MNRRQGFLVIYMLALVVYWVVLFKNNASALPKDSDWNYFFSFAFSLIPLIGGFVGIFVSRGWGWLKSAIGRAIFFLSFGLFTWGAGSMVFSYYNFFKDVAAPYPGFADIGFILSIPLWTIGVINLSKATGARFALKALLQKMLLIVIPLAVLAASYYLLVIVARGGVLSAAEGDKLKLFLDLAYPSGDVIILTVALVIFGLSLRFFGGLYKFAILSILLGLSGMYFADFMYSYTTTTETFYVGQFGDLLFALALFFMTLGVFGFATKPKVPEKVQ